MLSIRFRDVGNTEFLPHHKKYIAPAIAAAGITAAGSVLSGLFGGASSNAAAKKQLQAVRETNQANALLAEKQNQWNIDQWNRQNEYNTPLAQRQRFEEAGINPYFALGNISSGQADSLSSADLANQQPVVSDLQGQGGQMIANGIANGVNSGVQTYFNGAMAGEQIKSLQIQNTLDMKTLMDKVNSLHYDSEAKRMSNELFNGSMQSLLNITKNQERMSYTEVATKNLEQVGTSYDVAMKRFTQKYIQPQNYRLAEMSLNQMVANIAYIKAQERYTQKQTDYLADNIAIQWLQANASWLNAKTNQYDVRNQAWNRNQVNYRENYVFNRTKYSLVKQVKLGVQQLELDYNNDKHNYEHWTYSFGQGARNLLGGWLPLSGSASIKLK